MKYSVFISSLKKKQKQMKARLFQPHQAIEQQLIWNQPEVDL